MIRRLALSFDIELHIELDRGRAIRLAPHAAIDAIFRLSNFIFLLDACM